MGARLWRVSMLSLITYLTVVCGAQDDEPLKGVLEIPSVSVLPAGATSRGGAVSQEAIASRTVSLPLQLWAPSQRGTFGKDTCVIEGEGTPLSEGTEVELLEEDSCVVVMHRQAGSVSRRYPLHLVRIRVLPGGQEGWTWSSAVRTVER